MNRKRDMLLAVIGVLASYRSPADAYSGLCRMTVQAITHTEKSGHAESTLRLDNIVPTAGSPLHQDSVLAVDLEYWIQDFEPGRYTIIPQFAESARRGTAGDFPDADLPVLTSPAGRVHFCFAMAYLWNEHLELPLNLHFLLTRYVPDQSVGDHWTSVSVASTEHLIYPRSK